MQLTGNPGPVIVGAVLMRLQNPCRSLHRDRATRKIVRDFPARMGVVVRRSTGPHNYSLLQVLPHLPPVRQQAGRVLSKGGGEM